MKHFLVTALMCVLSGIAAAAPAKKTGFDPAIGLAGKANTDVVGIKLGMSETEVLEILKARTPALEIVTEEYTDPALRQIEASSEGCRMQRLVVRCYPKSPVYEKTKEFFVIELLNGRVWFVHRYVDYNVKDPGTPTAVAAMNAAVGKYGQLVSYNSSKGRAFEPADLAPGKDFLPHKTFDNKGQLLNGAYYSCGSRGTLGKAPRAFTDEAVWHFSFVISAQADAGVVLTRSLASALIDCEAMRTHAAGREAEADAAARGQAAARARQAGAAKTDL